MMAAMMLPSALPMIRLHRLGADDAAGPWRREARSALFVAGYLLVWAASGIVVWIAGRLAATAVPMEARSVAVAAVLLAAGVYQLTPLKARCLRACRTPMDFLLTHWYPGARETIHPRVVMPEGLVVKEAALVGTKHFTLGGPHVAYDHSGKYGAFGFFQYFG